MLEGVVIRNKRVLKRVLKNVMKRDFEEFHPCIVEEQGTFPDGCHVSATRETDPTRNHHRSIPEPNVFSNQCLVVSLYGLSPHTPTTIMEVQIESGRVC